MKVLFIRFSLLLLGFAVLFSCKRERQNDDTPNDIVYDTISVSKAYHIDNDTTKPFCSLDIKYIYPEKYSNMEVVGVMQKELNFVLLEDEKYEKLEPTEAIKKYVEDYIANYKQDVEEQFSDWEKSGESEDYFSYQKTLNSEIMFDKGGIISYQMVSTDYKGGANSSKFSRNVVVDLKTGHAVYEKDIFVADYKEALNTLLINKIMKQNNVSKTEDLVPYGYINVEDLTSNNNFYVDDKGITYVFNPGEFSIFTLEIRTFLPYSEIKSILKEDSPIAGLAGL